MLRAMWPRTAGIIAPPEIVRHYEIDGHPVFGPVVMLGLRSVCLEVLNEVGLRLAPFDLAEDRRMVDELQARRAFDGVRGSPSADIEALPEAP